ncbi:hypothetical protein, partial [Acinetobacter indicus]|uniref:hypothetical protein n=1 Tax=Acinetobacter indicus TaxID=756892 RepID=UPI00148A651F
CEEGQIIDVYDGLKGADGSDGKSELELEIEANMLPAGATITDLMDYLKGTDGVDGTDAKLSPSSAG